MAYKWIKFHVAQLSSESHELLKAKRLRATRDTLTTVPGEVLMEREWFQQCVDRNVRDKRRLWLTRTEMESLSTAFDRFALEFAASEEGLGLGSGAGAGASGASGLSCSSKLSSLSSSGSFGAARISRLEFIQLVLSGGASLSNAGYGGSVELSVASIEGLSALFDHAKTHFRSEFVIPGKQHPYLAERRRSTLKHHLQTYLSEKLEEMGVAELLKPRGAEEARKEAERETERRRRERESESLTLLELLSAASFWKWHAAADQAVEMDDVNYYFFLFDAGKRAAWSEGDFCAAMRALLEGIYISDYEEGIALPRDCDPAEREREEKQTDRFKSIDELELANAQRMSEEHQRRLGLVDRYLDALFDDIDRAGMGKIDIEDVEEWLEDNAAAKAEFQLTAEQQSGEDRFDAAVAIEQRKRLLEAKTVKGTKLNAESLASLTPLQRAFKSVRADDYRLSRRQFYAFIENSHVLSHTLSDKLELKLFELSRAVLRDEFPNGRVTLSAFRNFLRDSPDKRVASIVVRVSRAVRESTATIPESGRRALLGVLAAQAHKPRYREARAGRVSQTKRKQHVGRCLVDLRKSFTERSPLEQIRIMPIHDPLEQQQQQQQQ
jgi:hypothetical protein